MRKRKERAPQQERVLARLLASDIRAVRGGVCDCDTKTVTATEVNGRKDITNVDGDGD